MAVDSGLIIVGLIPMVIIANFCISHYLYPYPYHNLIFFPVKYSLIRVIVSGVPTPGVHTSTYLYHINSCEMSIFYTEPVCQPEFYPKKNA